MLLQANKHSPCASIHDCDLMSADNLCKQFGPRSGPTECRPDLNPNRLTLSLIVFLKDFFEKVNFEKSEQMTTKA